MFTRVKINTASLEEISELYDISPRIAELIIKHRENKPLLKPEDLAEIDGVSYKLAITLSPHIDWSLPLLPKPLKQRSWLDTIYWVLISLIVLLSAIMVVVGISAAESLRMSFTMPDTWLKMWVAVAGFMSLVWLCLIPAAFMVRSFTRDIERSERGLSISLDFARRAIWSSMLMMLGVFLYSFYSDSSVVQGAFAEIMLLIVLGLVFGFVLFVKPDVIKVQRLTFSANLWLSPIFDTTLIILSLFMLWFTWLSGGKSIISLIASVGMGIVLIATSMRALRQNDSLLQATISVFLNTGKHRDHRLGELNEIMTWLNMRLPNVEHQRLLKEALEKGYPAPTRETFGKGFVFTVGIWILLAALGGIVEKYAQDWWQILICYLFGRGCS